ncbi:MAG: tRNA preQ1(34) S-adenosylmethionine ribosyltransferase-isomerase QueA [Candidatus Hydrothermarchaeota archaeon]|nr:tRNA preQ1(34) S-adenosylmethionine ribosyltransferase-isomerase QueA [Candidatus Hydrothermarchaeota archaeon]
MKLHDFDYCLPKELIAQAPVEPRSSSRLMVLNGDKIEHRKFYEFVDYLRDSDVLVVNDSKVIPARIAGRKKTGGRVEVLLISKLSETKWNCLVKGKVRSGSEIFFEDDLQGMITGAAGGKFEIEFNAGAEEILEKYGEPPTPPYIKQKTEKERYQTVYAKNPGSIAAPTAGLHFTKELLEEIESRGIKIASITLHIGLGTFAPVKVENIAQHKAEVEYFEIDDKNAEIINEEGEVIAVGTTTLKALESAADERGRISATSGRSDLFVFPPYKFKTRTSGLITNFHLPKSTPLMLVCAYAGRERILKAYEIAIKNSYRFYSFGDAMLIMR